MTDSFTALDTRKAIGCAANWRSHYLFLDPRGDESLTVYVNDEIVYYDNADTTLAMGQLTTSGEVYVGKVAASTAQLNFVLRTDGMLGGGVILDNLRVYAVPPFATSQPRGSVTPLSIQRVPPPQHRPVNGPGNPSQLTVKVIDTETGEIAPAILVPELSDRRGDAQSDRASA